MGFIKSFRLICDLIISNLTNPLDTVYYSDMSSKTPKLKYRRAQSVGRAENIVSQEKKERRESPDLPCHEPKDSLLSSSSNYTNYRGVLNLCIILLVLSTSRVALENIIKYGILVDPSQWLHVLLSPGILPSVQIVFGLNVFILNSFFIEKYVLASGFLRETTAAIITIANITLLLIVPPYVVFVTDCHPVGSSFALGQVSIVCLKLISYHMVNYWCRKNMFRRSFKRSSHSLRRYRSFSQSNRSLNGDVEHKSSADSDADHRNVRYPDNLNLKDIYYFMFAPTLCYELNFPRSQRIRKRFLLRRFFEMFFLVQLILGLCQQWIVPTINNSLKPFQEMNYIRMFERLLKLAVPNHVVWLLFFYCFFHSSLNFIGELLRFADREFYRDWWNSESVNYFWSNWNIPVHKWCLRHLYKPLLARGFTKCEASTVAFIASAFFHEYLVSIPLKMFRIWAFSGMLFQIPFAILVNKYLYHYPQWANVAVWVSLIIGQPLCILMYYHDYYVLQSK